MPQFHSSAANKGGNGLDTFTVGYVMALYFTDTGEDEQPDSEAQMAPETLLACIADCRDFKARAAHSLVTACRREGYSMARAGHDFWLTRNHHGAGFWDRTELAARGLGQRLTDYAHSFGERYTYAGDDGLIYLG